MQEPPIVLLYPLWRLLHGALLSSFALVFGLAFLLLESASSRWHIFGSEPFSWTLFGQDPARWFGLVVLALGLAGLAQFGSSLISRRRFGALRIDADGFEYRLGIRTKRARFLECGPFHFVDYLGPDAITWRSLAVERALPPDRARIAPDPSDRDGSFLELPASMTAGVGGLEGLCELLNRRRGMALARSGRAPESEPLQRKTIEMIVRPKRRGFLSPPAISREIFIFSCVIGNPALLMLGLYFYDRVAVALAVLLAPLFRLTLGPASHPAPLLVLLALPIIILAILVWTTWLTAGRLRDLGESAGFWRAFAYAFLSGNRKRRKLLGRKGIGL